MNNIRQAISELEYREQAIRKKNRSEKLGKKLGELGKNIKTKK